MVLALGLVLGACSDPYAAPPPRAPAGEPAADSPAGLTPVVSPTVGDARPAAPVPAPRIRGHQPAARSVLSLARAYAADAINWDWRTLPNRLRALRRLTAGQLSAELDDAIDAAERDESLARDRPSSQGTVVAVTVEDAGDARRLVVVTREREAASSAEPFAPSTHRVYLASARRQRDGWAMVSWRRAP
jgi:hypothetical protein